MNDSFDSNDPLRSRLRDGADLVDLQPDWNDFTSRLGRSYRRRVRLIGASAAFVVAAGITGGYLAGRAGSDGGDNLAAAPGGGEAGEGVEDSAGDGDTTTTTVPAPVTDAAVAAGGVAVSSRAPYSLPEMTRLFVRDGAGGVAIRMYSQTYEFVEPVEATDVAPVAAEGEAVESEGGFAPYPPVDWQPASWCNPSGDLIAEVSTADIAVQAWFGRYDEFPPDETMLATYQRVGEQEKAPVGVVVTQVPADVTEVRVTFADGTVDSMAPAGGVAALAAPAAWDPGGEATVEAIAADGSVVASSTVTDQGYGYGGGLWDRPECQPPPPPPPTLPDPGEQPDDPDAAAAGVRSAFETVYAADGDGATEEELEAKLALVDDPAAVREAFEQLGEAYPGLTVTATVEDLVFTAPDRAVVLYRLDTSITDFDSRLGEAVLVDGTWKVVRGTLCADLSLGGGSCGDEFPVPGTVVAPPTTAGG